MWSAELDSRRSGEPLDGQRRIGGCVTARRGLASDWEAPRVLHRMFEMAPCKFGPWWCDIHLHHLTITLVSVFL